MEAKYTLFIAFFYCIIAIGSGRTGFEKLTGLDYKGDTYYTIRNLTLWECQGWCREEPECAAASYSFVLNPITPTQDTLCLLQNKSLAMNASSKPQRAVSLYYMVKLHIRSDHVCSRPWTFERVPNKMVEGFDDALMYTHSKEDCLAACLNENHSKEKRFTCRSVEYNYLTLECHLSSHDRRSFDKDNKLVDAQGVDYFENLCLAASESCEGNRDYQEPKLGIRYDKITHYVDLHYYVDKDFMANSIEACKRACEMETDFLCRSFLFKGPPSGSSYNCQLFHLDHHTLPDGSSTFLSTDMPLMDGGGRMGKYKENICQDKSRQRPSPSLICKQTTTRDRRFITQILCFDKINLGRQVDFDDLTDDDFASRIPTGDGDNSGSSSTSSGIAGDTSGDQTGNETGDNSGIQTGNHTSDSGSSSGSGSGEGDTGISHGDDIFGGGSSQSSSSSAQGGGSSVRPPTPTGETDDKEDDHVTDVNCDSTGVCYDVSVHCKDTRIVIQVQTTKPFNGRIYALGRSETCNVDVINSDAFRLDLTMEGQDCNTQSGGGVFTNTIVVQHHSVVMTKTDKIYKVRCTYDMSSKNITFGMMPIRDPAMIPITSAPEAPPPRIRILDATLKEVQTVRIGDKLTFRIEIPEDTPYAIFARSCVAMAKDSRSTFQIIDDDGCPVEPTIFPHFVQSGSALQAIYEAFRFTESYGVIFQCNVKYCLGDCEPAKCRMGNSAVYSYGRRKRGLRGLDLQSILGDIQETTKEEALATSRGLDKTMSEEEMSISQEILVLDLGDEQSPQYKTTSEQANLKNHFMNATNNSNQLGVTLFETCPTRSSVLALAVTCAILLLIYVLTVFYFVMRKWTTPTKHVH